MACGAVGLNDQLKGQQEDRSTDGTETKLFQLYSSMEIVMTPALKAFRERTMISLNEYGIGNSARNGTVLISGRGKE